MNCNACDNELTDTNWYPSYRKKQWNICKLCEKARQLKWGHSNKLTIRRRNLRRDYGLELEDYDKMFKEQSGVCAICSNTCIRDNLCVDHDHNTGKIRGLLCINCNAALGGFKDDPILLDKAKEYLCGLI